MKTKTLFAIALSSVLGAAHSQQPASPVPSEIGQRLMEAELNHVLRLSDQRRSLEQAELDAKLAEANAKRLDGEKRVAEAKRDKERADRGEDTGPNARRLDSTMMGLPPPPGFGGMGAPMPIAGSAGFMPAPIDATPPPVKRAPPVPVEPPPPRLTAVVGKKGFFDTPTGPAVAGVGEMAADHRVISVGPSSVTVAWRDKSRVLQVPQK